MYNAGAIKIDMTLNDTQYRSKLIGARKATHTTVNSINSTLHRIATGAVFARATLALLDFERELANVKSIASELNMGVVRQQLLDLDDVLGDVTKNTKALYYAWSAGIRGTEKEMTDFVGKMAMLGRAIKAESSTTVSSATTLMNAYGLSVKDAGEVTDWFYQVVKLGKTTGSELAISLGRIVSSASSAGISLNELGSSIASLTRIMPTQQAIIALNQAILSIVKPTAGARKMAEQLGIEFNATALRTKGFLGVLKEVKEASHGNIEVMAKLFGSVRALKASAYLAGEGFSQVTGMMEEFKNKSGSAMEAFKAQTARLNTTWDMAMVSMNKGLITLADAFAPLIKELGDTTQAFGSMLKHADKFDIVMNAGLGILLVYRKRLTELVLGSEALAVAKKEEASATAKSVVEKTKEAEIQRLQSVVYKDFNKVLMMTLSALNQSSVAFATEAGAIKKNTADIAMNAEGRLVLSNALKRENALLEGNNVVMGNNVVVTEEATVATIAYANALKATGRSSFKMAGGFTQAGQGASKLSKGMGALNTIFLAFMAYDIGKVIGKWLLEFPKVKKVVDDVAKSLVDFWGGDKAKKEAVENDAKYMNLRLNDLKKYKELLIKTGTMNKAEFDKLFKEAMSGVESGQGAYNKIRKAYLGIDEAIRKGGADVTKTLQEQLEKQIFRVDKNKRDELFANFKKEMGFDLGDLFLYDINSDTFKKGKRFIEQESSRLIEVAKDEQKKQYIALIDQSLKLGGQLTKLTKEQFTALNNAFKLKTGGIDVLEMVYIDHNSDKFKKLAQDLQNSLAGVLGGEKGMKGSVNEISKEMETRLSAISVEGKMEKQMMIQKYKELKDIRDKALADYKDAQKGMSRTKDKDMIKLYQAESDKKLGIYKDSITKMQELKHNFLYKDMNITKKKIEAEKKLEKELVKKREEAYKMMVMNNKKGSEEAYKAWRQALLGIDSELENTKKKQKELQEEMIKQNPLYKLQKRIASAGGIEGVKTKSYKELVYSDLRKGETIKDSTIERLQKTMTESQKNKYDELVKKNLAQGDSLKDAKTDAMMSLLKIMETSDKKKDNDAKQQITLLAKIEQHLAKGGELRDFVLPKVK